MAGFKVMTCAALLSLSWTHFWKRPEPSLAPGIESLMHARYPESIAHFRSGLQTEPWDSRFNEGLQLARSQVMISVDSATAALLAPESTWYPGLLLHPLVNFFCYFTYIAFCVALTKWFFTRRGLWKTLALLFAIPTVILASNTLVKHLRDEQNRTRPFIVTTEATPMRLGNSNEYPVIMMLPAGAEARVIRLSPVGSVRYTNWIQIEFAGGLTGWINRLSAVSEFARAP